MDKKIIIFISIGIIILAGVVLFFVQNQNQPSQENKIVYFYGDGCSFCAKVDEFVKENKVDEKVFFERKEAYNNKDNAAELLEKAGKCGLAQDEIGVPFLWDGSKCFVGDADIINFFKQKAGIQ
jgi:glutaredoxin